MPVFSPIVQKGGVGKSMIATQFAMFAALRGCSVALLDFDHQRNATSTLRGWDGTTVSETPAALALTEGPTRFDPIDPGTLTLYPGDDDALLGLERQADSHNAYATNLRRWLREAPYDLIVIDTNPSADIRQVATLASATHAVAPVTLSQESVDGVSAFLRNPRIGVLRIRETINPDLKLLGLLMNQVRKTKFQTDNLSQLVKHHSRMLMMLETGQPAAIPLSTAIPEAQAAGEPFEIAARHSSTARDAWTAIRPIWQHMATAMALPLTEPTT